MERGEKELVEIRALLVETVRRYEELVRLGIETDEPFKKTVAWQMEDIAEDYIFDSMFKTGVFGGVHYDYFEKSVCRGVTDEKGKHFNVTFDIFLHSTTAACIIEVKYNARKDDVLDLVNVKVEWFKRFFPQYAGYELYLGLGALSFEKGVEAEAKAYGIGLLKVNGDAVEIDDVNLTAY